MIKFLVLIDETYTNGYIIAFISIISLACTLSAILVIISKNPIVSVLFLIGLFLGIACYLFMLGLNFIGLSYLLVYVGAVSILFLFILMLINVRVSELLYETSKSIPLVSVIVICFNYSIIEALPYNISSSNVSINDINMVTNSDTINSNFIYYTKDLSELFASSFTITYIFSKFWDGSLVENTYIASLGNIMYTSYSIWLIITSIILLLAMIGSIIITIKQNTTSLSGCDLRNLPKPNTSVRIYTQSIYFNNKNLMLLSSFKNPSVTISSFKDGSSVNNNNKKILNGRNISFDVLMNNVKNRNAYKNITVGPAAVKRHNSLIFKVPRTTPYSNSRINKNTTIDKINTKVKRITWRSSFRYKVFKIFKS